MTQGGGFQSGDDFVALRVNMDIPTEGLSSIKELSQAMERMRSIAEAGAKTNMSYVGYLQQMAQAAKAASEAHLQLEQQLQRNSDLQNRMMGGTGSTSAQLPMSRAVPQGYTDNFSGMGSGMGGTRGPSPSDAPSQIQAQQMVQGAYGSNPQQYVNAQAGRFRTNPNVPLTATGAPDWGAQAQQVSQREMAQQQQAQSTPDGSQSVRQNLGSGYGGGGLAHNIMNEMAIGGSVQGMAGLGHRALTALGSRGMPLGNAAAEGESGGGLGGMAGMLGRLGPAGMIAGAGLAGLGLVERGGGMYQDYKKMGLIRGGGAGEGMDSEMQVRALALNPFISNEQARSVIMAGLTEGYSGKSFDTVTQFMTQNLKDMNISVADSVQMLRKNVIEGGATPEGTQSTLSLLKEMSKTGSLSLPDRTEMFKQASGALVSSGVPGNVANKAAAEGTGIWDDDQLLKGKFSDLQAATAGTTMGGNALEMYSGMRIPGLNPEAAGAWVGEHGGDPTEMLKQAVSGLVGKYFPRGFNKDNPGDFNKAIMVKNLLAQQFNMPLDVRTVIEMIKKVSGPSPFSGDQKMQQAATQVTGGESVMSDIGQAAGSLGANAMALVKSGFDVSHGDYAGAGRAWDQANHTADQADYNMQADAHNPLLDKLVGQYGPGGVEVVDQQGNATALNGSQDQTKGLASGSLNWRRKGESGSGTPLSAIQQAGSNVRGGDGGGNTNVGVNFSPATVSIKLDNSGMTASPNPVQLTPNQQQANAGYGSATMNNPPPGDGFGYYQGRYGFGAGGGGST